MAGTCKVDGLDVMDANDDSTRVKLLGLVYECMQGFHELRIVSNALASSLLKIGDDLIAKRLPRLGDVDITQRRVLELAANYSLLLCELTRVLTNLGGIVASRGATATTPNTTPNGREDEPGNRKSG